MFTSPADAQLLDPVQGAAQLLKALVNPDQLIPLCQPVAGEQSVTELRVLSDMGQPSLSQQLGVLRNKQLMATRREGKDSYCREDSPAVLVILQTLYGLFCTKPVATKPNKLATVGRNTLSHRLTVET